MLYRLTEMGKFLKVFQLDNTDDDRVTRVNLVKEGIRKQYGDDAADVRCLFSAKFAISENRGVLP